MKILKKFIKWLTIILVVFIVSIFVFTAFIINHFKPDVELAIKKQTGMNAEIEGNLQLKILPGCSLVINKLNLVNNETYFLRCESGEFSIDFKSFILNQQTLLTSIQLNNPQVFIFKDENGKFNFETASENVKMKGSFVKYNLIDLKVIDGKLLYINPQQNDTLFISGIFLNSKQIKAVGSFENFSLKNSYFEGTLRIGKFKLNALGVRDIQLKIVENSQQVLIEVKMSDFYGGNLSGNVSTDFSLKPSETKININASNIKIDSLLMDFETASYLKGKMKLEANLQFNSFNWYEARKSMNGNLSLSGENVYVYGFNTGVVVDKFNKTGQFSAINAGAALMSGPVDVLLSNSQNLENLLTYDSGDSLLANQFVSKWKFSNGLASAANVAFRDGSYRIAVLGEVDILNRTYQDLSISLLRKNSCPLIGLRLNGPYQTTLLESFSDIENGNSLSEAIVSRKNCTSPYLGSILAP